MSDAPWRLAQPETSQHAGFPLGRGAWRPAGACLLVGLVVLASPSAAQDVPRAPLRPATLDRPESPVVVTGLTLESFRSTRIDELRLMAWHEGGLRTIPFQFDERTPEEQFAFREGAERRSDTDDGRLDDNDELVFMARDVGPQVPPAAIDLGQAGYAEVLVRDPRGGQRGWVYLLHFPTAPPPPANRSYVALDWDQGELLGWSGFRAQVVGPPHGTNVLELHQLRFATPEQSYGADILDRAKVQLRASYLFLDLERRLDEVRVELLSYSDGPVRVVASYALELYLIWGHWIRSTRRCQLVIYGNRLELDLELELPVALEATPGSELRASFDFSPSAGKLRVWSDRNPRGYRPDGRSGETMRNLVRKSPRWVCASTPSGSLLARLEAGADLGAPKLFLADERSLDPPEDVPGSLGNTGFVLDLTGLGAGTYRLRWVLQLGPSLGRGEEDRLLRVDDAPLQGTLTAVSAREEPEAR